MNAWACAAISANAAHSCRQLLVRMMAARRCCRRPGLQIGPGMQLWACVRRWRSGQAAAGWGVWLWWGDCGVRNLRLQEPQFDQNANVGLWSSGVAAMGSSRSQGTSVRPTVGVTHEIGSIRDKPGSLLLAQHWARWACTLAATRAQAHTRAAASCCTPTCTAKNSMHQQPRWGQRHAWRVVMMCIMRVP